MKNIVLEYSLVDWDDNILHMDTKIIMEKCTDNIWNEVEVSTTDFASFRKSSEYRLPLTNSGEPDFTKAYSNFRDNKKENIFLKDMIDSLNKKAYAPSFDAFKRCLIGGKLLFIITARGNEPNTLKEAIKYFILNELTLEEQNTMKSNLLDFYEIFKEKIYGNLLDNYLNNCLFIGVSSDYYKTLLNDLKIENINYSNVEQLKKYAVSYIVNHIHTNYKKSDNHLIKIGFSDDDKANVSSIKELFNDELKKQNIDTHFVVYDTSKNEDGSKNYIKHII